MAQTIKKWEAILAELGLAPILPDHSDKTKTPKIMQDWKNPANHDFGDDS